MPGCVSAPRCSQRNRKEIECARRERGGREREKGVETDALKERERREGEGKVLRVILSFLSLSLSLSFSRLRSPSPFFPLPSAPAVRGLNMADTGAASGDGWLRDNFEEQTVGERGERRRERTGERFFSLSAAIALQPLSSLVASLLPFIGRTGVRRQCVLCN